MIGACSGGGGGGAEEPTLAVATPNAVIGPVEQHKQQRLGTGLTAWDPRKTADGFTVVATNDADAVQLVDMNGEVAHEWAVAEPESRRSVSYARMLENGNLFVLLKQPTGGAPPFVFKGAVTMEVDWNGNVLWELEDADQHHDGVLLPNGNILALRTERVPDDFAAQVPGGLPTEDDGMWGDWVAERTKEGEVVWEWHAWEHMDPAARPLNPQDQRNEWSHGNSVDQMPDGNVVVSFRNINTVVIVDRESGEIVWEAGAPELAQQHNAHPLPNGNLLLFDNGTTRSLPG